MHALPTSVSLDTPTPTYIRIHTYATKLSSDDHRICNHHRPPPNVEVIHILPSDENELSRSLCSNDRLYESVAGPEMRSLHIRATSNLIRVDPCKKHHFKPHKAQIQVAMCSTIRLKFAHISIKNRHIQHKSLKTPPNDFNNDCLLFCGHLVVAR